MTEPENKNKSLHDYIIAAPWNQDRVDCILKILNKREDFKGNDAQFSIAYGKREIPLEPEVYNQVLNMNPAWLKRYRRRLRECGISGLLSGHGKKGPRRLKQKYRKFILRHIVDNPYIRTVRVWEYLINKYGKICDRRTVERFVKDWGDKNAEILATLRNPSKAKNDFMASFGKADEGTRGYLDIVEIDNTPGDVVTSDGKRHKIIAAVDIFSRDACALISDVSSDIANNAMLRKLMLEKGIPKEIRADNAKEYRSKYFRAVCAEFNIRLPVLPPGAPEKRPFVERYFGTLTTKLFPEIPGWCGRDILQRQNIRERERWSNLLKPGGEVEIPVSLQQFKIILDDFNEYVYRQTHHKGINCAPVEKIAGSIVEQVENPRELDILLAPRDHRTVGKKGIQFQGGLFQSIDLAGLHIGADIEIRQDLEDASRIYVFDEKGQFICIAHDTNLAGLTVADYKSARKLQAEKRRRGIKELKDLPSVAGTGMEALIAARKAGPQIVPFIRHTKLEGHGAEEARKAVEADAASQDEIMTEASGEERSPRDPAYQFHRYELLIAKPVHERNEKEREFIERFEKSQAYYLVYEAEGD